MRSTHKTATVGAALIKETTAIMSHSAFLDGQAKIGVIDVKHLRSLEGGESNCKLEVLELLALKPHA